MLIINFIILAKTRRPVLVVGTHSDDPSCTKKVVTETLDKMHKKYKGKINNNNNNDDNNWNKIKSINQNNKPNKKSNITAYFSKV